MMIFMEFMSKGNTEFCSTRLVSLMRFWCLFVSKETPNKAVMTLDSSVLIVLVSDQKSSNSHKTYSLFPVMSVHMESLRQTNIKCSPDLCGVLFSHEKNKRSPSQGLAVLWSMNAHRHKHSFVNREWWYDRSICLEFVYIRC